jgi:hypothetical protein
LAKLANLGEKRAKIAQLKKNTHQILNKYPKTRKKIDFKFGLPITLF